MRRTIRIAVAATLAMVVLGGCASSWVEGDDPGEKGYDSSNPFSSFDYSDEIDQYNADQALSDADRELSECEADTRTLMITIFAWNAEHASGNPDYPTPWPNDMSDVVDPPTKLLKEPSELHDIEGGDGTQPPKIVVTDEQCEDEEIMQIPG